MAARSDYNAGPTTSQRSGCMHSTPSYAGACPRLVQPDGYPVCTAFKLYRQSQRSCCWDSGSALVPQPAVVCQNLHILACQACTQQQRALGDPLTQCRAERSSMLSASIAVAPRKLSRTDPLPLVLTATARADHRL